MSTGLGGRFAEVALRRVLRKLDRPAMTDDGVVTAFRDGQVTLRSARREDGFTLSDQETDYQGVEPGDLVIHGLDAFAGSVGVSESRGKCSPVYHVCRAENGADARYIASALRALAQSGYLAAQAGNVRQRAVDFRNWQTLARIVVPMPPGSVQRRIADYLEAETARIDGLVSARQQTLLLLNEHLEAAIRSRIPPVGDCTRPGTSRIREVAALVNGFPFDSDLFTSTGDMPLVRIRDLAAEEFATFINGTVPPRAVLNHGDVVIGMDGDFNVVLWERGPAALNQRLCALRARRGHDPRYLAFALRHPLRTINDLTFSTTVKHLSSTDVLRIRIPEASAGEQRAIADELDALVGVVSEAEARVSRQIDLLIERRRALITAAVTGQFEIPGVAA